MMLMYLTFALTIIWSVQVGVAVSLIISLLLVVKRSSKTRMTILVRLISFFPASYTCKSGLAQGHIPGTDRWKAIDENPEAEEDVPGTLIVRLRENLDFGVYISTRPYICSTHALRCSEHCPA